MKFIGEKFLFGCGFLTIALFAALFFSPNKVLAAYDYVVPEFNQAGDIITIPEYTGEAVLVCYLNYGESGGEIFYLGPRTSTQIDVNRLVNGNIDLTKKLSYFENPTIGSQEFWGTKDCILVKNYDSSKGVSLNLLYEKNPTCDTSFSFSNQPLESEDGNMFVLTIGGSQTYHSGDVNLASSTRLIYNGDTFSNGSNPYHQGLFLKDINKVNNFFDFYTDYCITSETVYRLNIGQVYTPPTPPPPVSNNYVMYYGDNPSYTIRRQKFDFPVVYNVCDAYNDYEDFYRLRFNKDDNTYLTSPPIGTENNPCSGIYTFSEIAPDYEDSGTGYISIIGELGNEIASTSPFLYTVYTPVGQVGAFIKPNFKSPVYADYYSETSTELSFYYDVCVDDNFNTSNQICIDFVDTGKMGQLDYNKTIHCQNLATCNGTINIDFPIETMDMTAYFRASYYSSNLPNNPFVSSNPFLFTLYNSDAKDTENIFSATSIHEMACSAEDWASDDWWNETKCSTFETGLNAMNNIAKSFKITILKFVGLIKNTFPFNFINLIEDTWEESETVELPQKLQFLNFSDSNGDIKIPVKIGAATSSIPIFGKSIFQNNESKDSYEKIRDLSTWMFRAMVLIYATMIGIKIYHELSGNKSE